MGENSMKMNQVENNERETNKQKKTKPPSKVA